jgi:uncharacterized protein DUF5710
MSVPERASVTAKRAGGPDRREAVSSDPGTAPIGPARRWVGKASIGTRSCVRAAPARGDALRQRSLMTRPRRRQAKRVGALWDRAERRWYAPRLGTEALERRPPFVDSVASSCWFAYVRPCLGIRLRRRAGRLGTSTVPPDVLQATAVDRVDAVQPGTLLPDVPGLRGFPAVVADAVACVAVAGPGRLRQPANLPQTVHAPSDCWSPPAWAEPGAQRKGETPDA